MTFTESFQQLWNDIALLHDRIACAVVHLNDTYLIDEQPSRLLPGFPRLIATIKKLREHIVQKTGDDRLVVVHSGDFLGPSRLGNADQGTAMIDMLNRSTLQYFVAGNHEFDYGPKEFEVQLLARAKFRLVCCNAGAPATVKNASKFALWPHAYRSDKGLFRLSGGLV
jgi:2',3'-cyclic-nucleotide 2'-phosphodiesterase (5'-nucleotidase family)